MYNIEEITNILYFDCKCIAVVGKGSQSEYMKEVLRRKLRVKLNHEFYDSNDVPGDKEYYIVCATPEKEALNNLEKKGIEFSKIIIWKKLYQQLEEARKYSLSNFLALPELDENELMLIPGSIDRGFSSCLISLNKQISSYLMTIDSSDYKKIEHVVYLLDNYLSIREYCDNAFKIRTKKLLFPSTGRCGGVSITDALNEHPSILLKVLHEGYAREIYNFLVLYKKNKISKRIMIALTCLILDQYDCHGGNPFCFLMPFIKYLSWYEFYMLKVNREKNDLLDSITLRNFHYTEKDFVPERITAWQWKEEDRDTWEKRSTKSKVLWYIDKVEQSIRNAVNSKIKIVETPIDDLEVGLNEILKKMNYPERINVKHLNTISKEKIYSLDERIMMYRKQSK